MIETIDNKQASPDPAVQEGNAAAQAPVLNPPPNLEHTKIKSNFTQSPSTYWALTVPLLSARYVAEAVNEIIKPVRKFYAKQKGILEETASQVSKAELKDTAWALGVGTGMVIVTSFYTARTYGDMKRQFKESVGWEMDKDPEKVGFLDMIRSKNILVRDAAHNLTSRSAKRFIAHVPFFAFLAPTPFRVNGEKVAFDGWITKNPKPIEVGDTIYSQLSGAKGSVNFGVGTNALYLASDALGRKRTFYEELQRLIDTKINHNDTLGQTITTQDLISLYDRQARRDGAPLPKMSSNEWQNDVKLFEHMADLMNQTYENIPKTTYADFTIPKLIYLMGMGLLKSDEPEKSIAYVEMANRYGIPAVKKVAADMKNGADINTALAGYPDALAATQKEARLLMTEADNAMQRSMGIASEPIAPEPQKLFTNEGLMKPRLEAPPASHVEKAAQKSENTVGVSI